MSGFAVTRQFPAGFTGHRGLSAAGDIFGPRHSAIHFDQLKVGEINNRIVLIPDGRSHPPAPTGDTGQNGTGGIIDGRVGFAKIGIPVTGVGGYAGIQPRIRGAQPGIRGAQFTNVLKHHCAPYQQAKVPIKLSTSSDISLNSSSEMVSFSVILLLPAL